MDTTIERARRRQAAREAQRGMTLIEIMIVIIIMAMIATGVSLGVMKALESSREDEAHIGACTIRNAATLYMARNPNQCPTMEDLARDFLDDEKSVVDPWEREFVIECGDKLVVYSTGKDGNEQLGCKKEKKE
jgi:general secretion pathway protein G